MNEQIPSLRKKIRKVHNLRSNSPLVKAKNINLGEALKAYYNKPVLAVLKHDGDDLDLSFDGKFVFNSVYRLSQIKAVNNEFIFFKNHVKKEPLSSLYDLFLAEDVSSFEGPKELLDFKFDTFNETYSLMDYSPEQAFLGLCRSRVREFIPSYASNSRLKVKRINHATFTEVSEIKKGLIYKNIDFKN